jgi:peptidoglycan hydrolase CwlO-like protein
MIPSTRTDAYESELERMNAAVIAENQSLQYDNKQLGALIKEYEQTLDTLMSTFRNRAVSLSARRPVH